MWTTRHYFVGKCVKSSVCKEPSVQRAQCVNTPMGLFCLEISKLWTILDPLGVSLLLSQYKCICSIAKENTMYFHILINTSHLMTTNGNFILWLFTFCGVFFLSLHDITDRSHFFYTEGEWERVRTKKTIINDKRTHKHSFCCS